MCRFLFIFIFSLQLIVIICASTCEDYITCSTCISNSFDDCVWCSEENYKGRRCQQKKILNETWCVDRIRKPDTKLNITKNINFSAGEHGGDIIQFKPQVARITSATPRASVNITMYYQPAKDAPLDIYFLIDNSGNIAQYKKSLINQTELVFKEIKSYTNNVRLGIGTFVEKPVLPYANPDEHVVYTFKNHLSLTNDSISFKNTLENIKNGSNYDAPEDLFDGLMQVMLCKKQIDWRKDGRKIIVVFTNAFYHTAGDGKIIGAFKRHNMECYINDNIDTIMDYPSIAQVNKVAKDNGYIIIFAYIENKRNSHDVRDYYQLLTQKVYGAKYEELSYTNIAKIIRDEYIKIVEDVYIEYNSSFSGIQVKIQKKCLDCKALHFNSLEFVATVKILSCTNSPKQKEMINLIPMSLNEVLQIEVEFECQCKCERQSLSHMNIKKCNGEGDYQCGICKCKPGRFGDDCTCKNDTVSLKDNYEKCRKNPDDALRCSGHGECSCGKCESCHEGFSGPFCEYDDNACPRPGGRLCSGHGKCAMGMCQCDPNWIHSLNGIEDCGCTLDQTSCIAPHSNKICSGNGECKCGRCICNSVADSSDTCKGRYCDKCSWFAEKRCEELEDYAYCKFLNETSCQDIYNLSDTSVVFANRSEINSPDNTEWYMANLCRVKKGDDETIFVFKYYYTSETDTGVGTNNTKLILVIQKELDVKPPADIWVAVGSSIGGILLIGLLSLLLWKILTDFYDAKEYEQFKAKALAAGYDVKMTENPWYEPPTVTYVNPTCVSTNRGNFASRC